MPNDRVKFNRGEQLAVSNQHSARATFSCCFNRLSSQPGYKLANNNWQLAGLRLRAVQKPEAAPLRTLGNTSSPYR
jgi:hypothetical protein